MSNVDKELSQNYHQRLILNRPAVRHALQDREEMKSFPANSFEMIMYNYWFPVPRLVAEDLVAPYGDPEQRYTEFPEETDLPWSSIGWDMEKMLSFLIPKDNASHMLQKPLFDFLNLASKEFYNKYSTLYPQYKFDSNLFILRFAEISQSNGIGLAFDKIYRNLGNSLKVISGTSDGLISANHQEYLKKRTDNGRLDLDIALISLDNQINTDFLIQYWDKIRSDYEESKTILLADGRNFIVAKNFEFTELPNQNGQKFFEGWRLIKEMADDGTELITLQSGIFSSGEYPLSEKNINLEKNTFSIEFNSKPYSLDSIEPTNTRAGNSASLVDRFARLHIKSTDYDEMNLVIQEWERDFDLQINGRFKWRLFENKEIFNHKAQIIEVLTRGLKQMTSKVGAFYIDEGFGGVAEEKVNSLLWETIDSKIWSDYLVKNLMGAAHLSPLVFGSNMIPNSRFDALPQETGEGSLRRKLAEHGNDYTLSLGQLWPGVFSNMSDDQVIKFLSALPHQKDYTNEYLADLDRYEQTGNIGELKLEHQGVYYIMEALKSAGVKFPDFGGNYLMQFLYLFRHPMDMEIENIKVAVHDLPQQGNALKVVELESEFAGD